MGWAITATLGGAALAAYSVQAQRASMRRAEVLISQIETVKQILCTKINSGKIPVPANNAALAALVLPAIQVEGAGLTGNPQADADTLGISSLSVGTLDAVNAIGTVVPGTPASVILPDGSLVTSESR
jgi:hypothetical protein